jgi:membrane associated rhomboid family serine protease
VFPYRDENETIRTPYATFVLIALNVLAWLLIQGAGSPGALARSICDLGLIPGELTLSVPPGTRFRCHRTPAWRAVLPRCGCAWR